MSKTKKAALAATAAVLMLAICLLFGGLFAPEAMAIAENEFSCRLTADEGEKISFIDESGKSDYNIIFSSDAIQIDYELSREIQTLFAEKGVTTVSVNPDSYVPEHAPHEILIGMTDRTESGLLLARLEKKCASADDLAWGYAVINGKLLFVANSNTAFGYGMQEFVDYLSENDLTVPTNLNVLNVKSLADYEKELADQAEAERQKIIAELIAKNEAFKNESRLTEGYKSMIGDNNAHYDKSPYPAPWVYPTKDQHPRYLITEKNVVRIKEMMNDPEYEDLFINLWNWAEKDISEGVFPEKKGGSGQINAYSEAIITGISARAMAYLLTGNEVYGYEAIIAVKNAMLTLKYTTDIHMDVYHGASHVMVVLAAVYDWCYDLLTEEDKWQMITGSVNCLWSTMEFNYPPSNYNGISGHGTGPQLLRDYMSLAVAFYDEAPDWWEFVMGRYFHEYLPVANEQYVNGWISQGTACYAPIKLMVQLWAAHLIKNCTGENFFIEDAALSVQLFVSQLQPNRLYFQTGDGGRNPNGAAPGFAEYFVSAALYNDPIALAWAKEFTNDYTKLNTGSIFTMTADFQLCFISHVTAEQEGIYDSIGLVQYFLDPAGQMTARNSWDEDAAAVFMKVGNMSMSNHDVYEHGTFQIYYKGLLAADSGSYKHYGGDSHYYYLQCTVAHNGLLIFNPSKAGPAVMNGDKVTNPGTYYYSGSQHRLQSPVSLQQWQDGTYRMAETTGAAWEYNLDGSVKYAYIAGDITDAYDDVTVDYVGRRMLTLYTGDEEIPMVFLVFDELISDEANYEKTFLLHTVKEPEVDTENMTATVIQNEGRLVMNSLYGAQVIEKIGGEGKAYWINGYYDKDGNYVEGKNCLDEYTPDDNYMNIWGRVQMRAVGEKETEFLTAMYVSDADSTATLEIAKYQNEKVYGATFGNNITMFSVGRDKAYKAFSFETEGKGLYNYYISGVADGTWQVKVDGVSVAYSLSSDEAGIITFIAPCGAVELIPGSDVIGANGGKILYSAGGAILPDDAPYAYNNEVVTPLPTIAYRGEDVFLGWYLSPEFIPEERVFEVPAGYTGTFRVYAKWLSTFINEDYSETTANIRAGNVTLNGIGYYGNGKPGSSFVTKRDEQRDCNYLEWIEGSLDSFINATSSSNNMSMAVAEDKSVSITVTIAAEEGKPNLASSYQMVAKVDVNGGAISSQHTHIFRTDTSGNILLGGTKNIGKVTTEPTTIRIAIDFKYGQFKAYDENGELLGSTAFKPSAATGATNTEQLMKCYTQYIFYWHGDSPEDAPDSTMRIYKIKMQDGNIFEGGGGAVGQNSIVYNKNGGTLGAGAPYEYSNEEPTLLPTDIKLAGYRFEGWYTTETFDEGTRVYYVPTDAKGPFNVYAKWRHLSVEEIFDGLSFNIKESTSGGAGQLNYNAGSTGEPKPGSSFVTETGADGNTYLKASVGSVNAIFYKADNNYNLTHFKETSISYELDLKKLEGIDFPTVTVQIATSGGKYGNLRIFTINEQGEARLAGSGNVFATVGEDAYTKIRVTLDFAASTISAYNENGEVIEAVRITSVPSGSGGAPTSMLEWQKVASNYLFYFLLSRSDKTEGAVSSLAVDNVVIGEGNLFEKEEILLPVGTGIIYKTDGGSLPDGAPTEYDPENGTLLPTGATRPGYVFGGWYTDEALSAKSRVYYVPAGTTGTFKVFAKWLPILAEEDYTDKSFTIEGSTQSNGAVSYNGVNAGCKHEVVTDTDGNYYLKFTATATGNGVIFVSNSSYDLIALAETAISYEFDLKKLEGYELSRANILIATPGADNVGNVNLASVNEAGEFKLVGSSNVIVTVGEDSFTKFRMTVDFAAGKVFAYDENNNELDSAVLKIPEVSGAANALEWQRLARNYLFYISLSKQGSAIGFDNLKVAEGRIFEKGVTAIPPRTGIEYTTNGGKLSEGAPDQYDPELGTILPSDVTRPGHVFGGWYTSPNFAKGTEAEYVPAGTNGIFKVYAKWLVVVTEMDYTGSSFELTTGQPERDGIVYNALNAGVSYTVAKDDNGNSYLVANNKVEMNAEGKPVSGNGVIRTTNSSYNINTFEEDAVTFELSFAKQKDVLLSTFSIILQSSSGVGGTGNLAIITSDAEGNVKLVGGTEVICKIVEGEFTPMRVSVDFAEGVVYAYDPDGKIIDSVTPTPPSGFSSLAQWQRADNGLKHHILFMSFFNSSQENAPADSAILVDDIRITDGMAVRTPLDKIPARNFIEYNMLGGKLPQNAPTEFDTETGVELPTPTRADSVFEGWYTSSDYEEGTRVDKIEAGTEGTVKLYARWLTVVLSNDYSSEDFVFNTSGQHASNGMMYNTLNDGVSMQIVEDGNGNKYVKAENAVAGKNGVIYYNSSSYNLTTFSETAVSYEFDLARIKDVQLSSLSLSIQTGGGAYGGFQILYVKEKSGEIVLGSEPVYAEGEEPGIDDPVHDGAVVVGNITEEFTTIRVTVDFAAATITAYGEGGEVLGTVTIDEVPEGTQGHPESMAAWQKVASPYVLYASVVRYDDRVENSGILFDNVTVTDGRAFG